MFSVHAVHDTSVIRDGSLAVLGTVAGLCFAGNRYGSLPLTDLLQPAIRHAGDGVRPDATQRRLRQSIRETAFPNGHNRARFPPRF